MPLVEVTEVIPADARRVWNIINDVESFPRTMSHVRSVKIVETGPDYRITAWEIDCKGFIMRWTEREEGDFSRLRIDYRQIEGDMSAFEGFWQLRALGTDSTEVTLSVQFEIGIPMLSEMLDPVAERAIQENSRKMLASLAATLAPRRDVAATP
jgi:ribosome-associated toxin RatA of RatAB toxin-antitoxin module